MWTSLRRLRHTLGLGLPKEIPVAKRGTYTLKDVTVINPTQSREEGASLEVSGSQIQAIYKEEPTTNKSDYAGCYALPGLIDLHVHLPPHNALRLGSHAALLYLYHGVTTIREAGDLDGTAIKAMQDLAKRDGIPTPRLFYCGPFIGAGKKTFRNTLLFEQSKGDTDADKAKAIIANIKGMGASFAKFYDGLTEPMIRALEQECIEQDLGMMGHVPAALTYEVARVQEVQHFFGVPDPETLSYPTLLNRFCEWGAVDQKRMDEIVAFSLQHGIHNTPTIMPLQALLHYRDYKGAVEAGEGSLMPKVFTDVIWTPENSIFHKALASGYIDREVIPSIAKKQQLTKQLVDAGAPVYLGTDVMQPFTCPGEALQREMKAFVDAGIALEQVWHMATAVAGRRLRVPKLGHLVAGAPADILLFDQDPTTSLEHLSSLRAVIRDGQLYTFDALREGLDNTLRFYRSPVIRRMAKKGAERAMARAKGRR